MWFIAGTIRWYARVLIDTGDRMLHLATWLDPKPLIEIGPGPVFYRRR